MTTFTAQRDKSVWLIFLVTLFLSGLFAILNLQEFVTVGIFEKTGDYSFGGEGPKPWYYKTSQLYATVNLIFGLLYFVALSYTWWTFYKVKKKALLVMLIVTLFLILLQLINGQST